MEVDADLAQCRRTALQPLPLVHKTDDTEIAGAPNPKPSAVDKARYGKLASLYTSFSTEFASYALNLCLANGQTRIADPFAGMGTLGEAGRRLPLDLTLNDLNPFAVLACVFRTSNSDELRSSIERVAGFALQDAALPEREAFLLEVNSRLVDCATPSGLLKSPLSGEARATLLDLHLIALIRIASHRSLRGSNPTWTKRAAYASADLAVVHSARDSVIQAARAFVDKIAPIDTSFHVSHHCGDVSDLAILDNELDAIITSPPYPNRTDYIRHYLPAAELLIGGDEELERRLRESQIGTPLIRVKMPTVELPETACVLIERIRSHGSYASERYYAKGFSYYFADMKGAFERMARWLRPNGTAIIVVQDAYYKDIRIPVADLLVDIAEMTGFALEGRKDFAVRQALSQLSAAARAATPKRFAAESIICLRRTSR